MTETIITVRGEFQARYPAERATITGSVALDGEDRADVFARVSDIAAIVRERLAELKFAQSITSWSADRVQLWAERPWNNEGIQLDPVTHARVGFSATFTDFDALATWIGDSATTDGITFADIAWQLSDATRTAATAEVRSRAVKDAVAKATVYAQSIGLGTVRATALADPGMLGDQAGSTNDSMSRAMYKTMDIGSVGGGAELSLKPEDIEVSALVDARFVAS